MFLAIYQVVLMTLMFIFSLTSFTIMLCSLTRYIKNQNNKSKNIEIDNLKKTIDFYNSKIAESTDKDVVQAALNDLEIAKEKLAKLESKKK